MKIVAGQALRFLISGAINTAVTYAVYLVLLGYLDYRSAYGVAFLSGIVFSYALNVRFVFRVRPNWRSAVLFPLVYVIQYLVGLGVLQLAVERFAIPREYALLASIAVSIPLTFALTRLLLNRNPPAAARLDGDQQR